MEPARDERYGYGRDPTPLPGATLDPDVTERAEHGLEVRFGMGALAGKSFVDVGAGCGMASLAAHRLGARRIVSIDRDPDAIAVTRCLRDDHADAGEAAWSIARASVLDGTFMRDLGTFDLVYAWDVVHHTGDLWTALGHVADAVAPGGMLAVSVGNDAQGSPGAPWYPSAARWHDLKTEWNTAAPWVREAIATAVAAWSWMVEQRHDGHRALGRRDPRARARRWLGQLPYAYASVEAVCGFMAVRGLTVRAVHPGGRDARFAHGMVFVRGSGAAVESRTNPRVPPSRA